MTERVNYSALGMPIYYSDVVPLRDDEGKLAFYKASSIKGLLEWSEQCIYANPELRPSIEAAIISFSGELRIDLEGTRYPSMEEIRNTVNMIEAIIGREGKNGYE